MKKQIAWTVKSTRGTLWFWCAHRTKKRVIEVFEDVNGPWTPFYEKGFRIVKVNITEQKANQP